MDKSPLLGAVPSPIATRRSKISCSLRFNPLVWRHRCVCSRRVAQGHFPPRHSARPNLRFSNVRWTNPLFWGQCLHQSKLKLTMGRRSRFNPLFWGQCLHPTPGCTWATPASCFNPLFWGQCLHHGSEHSCARRQGVSIPSSGGSAFTPEETCHEEGYGRFNPLFWGQCLHPQFAQTATVEAE